MPFVILTSLSEIAILGTCIKCSSFPVSKRRHVSIFVMQVRNFVALFSALLHHLTDALYCGEMNWLLVDIPLDQVTSYLPKEYQEEGVVSQVSLSNLLEAFREECVEREELSGATKRKVRTFWCMCVCGW